MEQDLYALSAGERDRFRGKRLGVVHQEFHLLPGFTALENLAIALRFSAGERGRGALQRASEMLEVAGLSERAHTPVERLSRGEAQRVAVARSLVHRPELLLTDEPTASLDAERGMAMLGWIDGLRRETGCAWLCVTHDSEVAKRFDHVLDARLWSRAKVDA
jgi:ABC-type lipoprotein export system ATPase subunit